MTLHIERGGAGQPMVLVHGFTQTAGCWGAVAEGFERDHEVWRVDAPGHGRSSAVMTDLWGGADLLADVVPRAVSEVVSEAASGGPGDAAVFLGYSMGGRFCLHLALKHPERVRALVVVGASGGIEDPVARAQRAARDEALALRLESDGVEAFLDEWLAQPLFASLPASVACRDERAANSAAGLASSLRLAGTGTQEPLWSRLSQLSMPVLAVAGSLDAKFTAEAERLAATIGRNATVALIDGAGHAAHLEQPEAFVDMVGAWLDEHDR